VQQRKKTAFSDGVGRLPLPIATGINSVMCFLSSF
jgi:hypothetical protein